MHELVKCNIKTGVRTCRTDVSLRDVTIAQNGKQGYTVQVTSRTRNIWRILGDFGKSQLVETRHWTSWDETCLGGRQLVFSCSQKPLWWVPHVLGGADEKARIERLCLSPYVEEPFKLKGNKRFRTWTKKLLHVFRISRSYVLCIYVINVPCTFCIFVYMAMVHFTLPLDILLDTFKMPPQCSQGIPKDNHRTPPKHVLRKSYRLWRKTYPQQINSQNKSYEQKAKNERC